MMNSPSVQLCMIKCSMLYEILFFLILRAGVKTIAVLIFTSNLLVYVKTFTWFTYRNQEYNHFHEHICSIVSKINCRFLYQFVILSPKLKIQKSKSEITLLVITNALS